MHAHRRSHLALNVRAILGSQMATDAKAQAAVASVTAAAAAPAVTPMPSAAVPAAVAAPAQAPRPPPAAPQQPAAAAKQPQVSPVDAVIDEVLGGDLGMQERQLMADEVAYSYFSSIKEAAGDDLDSETAAELNRLVAISQAEKGEACAARCCLAFWPE